MRHARRIGLSVIVVLAFSAINVQNLAAQAYTYTTIDYPGSNYMVPVGINNSGQVVGLY